MYIKINDDGSNQYPYTIGDLYRDNPNVSFPFNIPLETLAEFNVLPVVQVQQPPATYTEKVVEGDPVEVDGVWTQTWEVVDATAEEIEQYIASLQRDVVQKTQTRLDQFAQTRGYDGILSLCSYGFDNNPQFHQEARYGVEIRSATWSKLYEILAEVQAGERPMPAGYEDIEPELPLLEWPELNLPE